MMDAYTYKHLWQWLERMFREDEIMQAYDSFVGWLESNDNFDVNASWPEMYRRFQSETTLSVPWMAL